MTRFRLKEAQRLVRDGPQPRLTDRQERETFLLAVMDSLLKCIDSKEDRYEELEDSFLEVIATLDKADVPIPREVYGAAQKARMRKQK